MSASGRLHQERVIWDLGRATQHQNSPWHVKDPSKSLREAIATMPNHKVVAEFTDTEWDNTPKPGLFELLSAACRKEFDAVAIDELETLSNPFLKFASAYEILMASDVRLIVQDFDPDAYEDGDTITFFTPEDGEINFPAIILRYL